jgi:hypothetical protein
MNKKKMQRRTNAHIVSLTLSPICLYTHQSLLRSAFSMIPGHCRQQCGPDISVSVPMGPAFQVRA